MRTYHDGCIDFCTLTFRQKFLTTIQEYAQVLDKCSRPYLKQANDSWRIGETFVKVRGEWMYLYRAVESTGQTIDFLLNETRSTRAAKRYFRKMLGRPNITAPRVINVDKNACYIAAGDLLTKTKQVYE